MRGMKKRNGNNVTNVIAAGTKNALYGSMYALFKAADVF